MEELYNQLYNDGKYTKTFEDFKVQFGNPEKSEKLYTALNEAGDYTKSFDEFKTQFSIPAKIQDSASADPTVESVEDTGSKLEDGSLGLFADTQEKLTWVEKIPGVGKNIVTDFLGDIGRAWQSGWAQGGAVDPSIELWQEGSEISDEKLNEFIDAAEKMNNAPQTDEMIQRQKDYEEDKEKYGGVAAWFTSWAKNPTWLSQVFLQSMGNIVKSAISSEEALGVGLAGAGTLAGAAALAGQAGPQVALPEEIVTVPSAAIGGFMGGISGVMETGLTTAELLREELEKDGKEVNAKNIRALMNDENRWNDITNKAVKRGAVIGVIDGITGAVSGGVGKAVTTSVGKKAGALALGTIETSGGMLSETLGQIAADQDINIDEILTEGFADKSTAVVQAPGTLFGKKANYSINGEKMNGFQFRKAISKLDDEALMNADIQVNNDDVASTIVKTRRQDLLLDTEIDSKVSDVNDRSRLINLEKDLNKLKNNKTRSGQAKRSKINQEIDGILNKYEGAEVDVTVENRKKAILAARDAKVESLFEKYKGGAVELGKKLGFESEPTVFDTTDSYLEAIAKDQGINIQEAKKLAKETEGAFIGKGKIFIDKQRAKEVGAVSVVMHEILHPILNATIGNAKNQAAIVSEFKKAMTSNQRSWVEKQLKKNVDPSNWDTEYLNYFSDGILRGEINYNKTTFEKLKDIITRILKGKGFDNISFDSGRDVYNFLKEYNTSVQKTGRVSDVAVEAIKAAEAKTGRQAATVGNVGQMQLSKTLSPDQTTEVTNDIATIKQLAEENAAIAARFGKEPIKSGKQARLEQKVLTSLKPVIDKVITNRTKALYDPIPMDAKKSVSRQDFQDSMRSDIETMVLNEYNGAQDIEKFLVNRAYLRANDLAKRLGIEEKINVSLDTLSPEGKETIQLADTYDYGSTLTEIRSENARQTKLINPLRIFNKELAQEYNAAVEENLNTMPSERLVELSFAGITDLAPEVTAKFWGTTLKKVINSAANLATAEIPKMQSIIFENIDTFIKLLPEGAILEGAAASESLIGTGLGVPRKLQQAFYDKKERTTKGAGLIPFELKKNITKKDFAEAFGINEDGTFEKFGGKDPRAQTILALIRLYGKITSNTAIRQLAPLTEQQKVDIKAGAALIQFSETKKEAGIQEQRVNFENLDKNNRTYTDKVLKSFNLKEIPKLTDKPQGEQVFQYENLLDFIKTRNELLSMIPPELGAIRGLIRGLTASHYRVDSYGFDFLKSGYKNIVDKNGDRVSDEKIQKLKKLLVYTEYNKKLNQKTKLSPESKEIYDRIFGKNGLYENTKKSARWAKDPSLNISVIAGFKELISKGDETKIQNRLNQLNKANALNKAIAELYISILRDFVNKQGKNKKQRVNAVANILISNANIINSFRSLSSIDFVVVSKNDIETKYRFEHHNAMINVIENIAYQIMQPKGTPIEFISTASIVPSEFSKERDSSTEGKTDSGEGFIKIVNKSVDSSDTFIKIMPQFSKSVDSSIDTKLNKDFNKIIENSTKISSKKTISEAKSKMLAKKKGSWKFFVPPSAEDFSGLMYKLLGKGKVGNKNSKWFKENLFDPYAEGIRNFESYKQQTIQSFRKLKKSIKNVPKGLNKTNETGFTNDVAVRVYLWNKKGYEIPGLDKNDTKELVDLVNNNEDLKNFAEQINALMVGYAEPDKNWLAGTITTDVIGMINSSKREEFLQQWQENADAVFTKDNINKLRAAFGEDYVEALKDMLYRMKSGRNRPNGSNKLTNQFMNWVNDSVGTIMFFNTRSALLQTLSIANFINWGDNNPIKAAKAFSNQKQFWSDFAMIFNSDFLKQRRSGLKTDVNADDIANAAETSTNKAKAVLSSILKMGFLPTQIADSFAIAMGGASFYRNRIDSYIKEGLSQKEAESKAFLDFQEVAEETQQSSRPDRISQQQASPLGRIILAFANTPMQYMRLTKKAILDLKNRRGDVKTNVSKIIYYTAVQNIIFSSLQSALFAALFDDDDEELIDDKKSRIANSMLDTLLRGMGVGGAAVSTIKNIGLEIDKQSKKPRPDYTQAAIRSIDLSPPISSKLRKLMSAGRAFSYKNVRSKMKGYSLENPAFYAGGQIISATTNIPLDRAIKKADNIRLAMDNDTKLWQKIALALGYSSWDVGIVDKDKNKGKKGFGKTTKWKNTVWKKNKWKNK
jgi:citrate lyase gamma subunit